MATEWRQRSTAGAGGRIEVIGPGLPAGAIVEVAVRALDETQFNGERPIGLLKGQIRMSEDFDARVDDFDPYM